MQNRSRWLLLKASFIKALRIIEEAIERCSSFLAFHRLKQKKLKSKKKKKIKKKQLKIFKKILFFNIKFLSFNILKQKN